MLAGCSGSSSPPKTAAANGGAVVEHPEGDPSVPPELGGPGFTGEGWTTNNPAPLGDPSAVRGGTMLTNMPNWPENLRVYGTGSNTYFNSIVGSLCYESLCGIDPNTLEFVPNLATHWKISDDKMKFEFRINPKAHWSDGKPVTAQDVVATYRLIMDETLIDPMGRESMSRRTGATSSRSRESRFCRRTRSARSPARNTARSTTSSTRPFRARTSCCRRTSRRTNR